VPAADVRSLAPTSEESRPKLSPTAAEERPLCALSPRLRAQLLLAIALSLACGSAGAAQRPDARGYLTTPLELSIISQKADEGVAPYAQARASVLAIAGQPWPWGFTAHETCPTADIPHWNDNSRGTRVLYANALAYHLTGNLSYAQFVRSILETAMSQVQDFHPECDTNLGWGAPELVASADLIEEHWQGLTCTGPLTATPGDPTLGAGPCKLLFQNWLAKSVYPTVSQMATASQNNRGAAGTNTLAYVADYLWDRSDVLLVHHNPSRVNGGQDQLFTPTQAFAHARQLALDRMNGYRTDLGGSSCDYLGGVFQSPLYPAVKSQITPRGIIPEDARRDEYCNILVYNGTYQNYPQGHVGHNVQQCELLLRRGDRSCYDNLDESDLPDYPFLGPDGVLRSTHLEPGRGSIERAIQAIVVDSRTEWRHDAALEVALNYYRHYGNSEKIGAWVPEIDDRSSCSTNLCLTTLTHGLPFEFPLKAVDAPAGGEGLLVDVSLATGAARVPLEYGACAEPTGAVNALRGLGSVTGLAYWQHRPYALEDVDGDAHLVELTPSLCVEGVRVGATAVGFAGLEALAACPDGSFYSAAWSEETARARLVRIDRVTGVGALVGPHQMAASLRIVGLACATGGESLWALTAGDGARPPELLSVDPATGVEVVIGPTGSAPGALQALEVDRGAAAPRLLAAGDAVNTLDPATGAATLLGGGFGGVRALAMPDPSVGPDWDKDGQPDALDNCTLVANPMQRDTERDGYGNACDADLTNDGVVGIHDIALIAGSFGCTIGPDGCDGAADSDDDGVIGMGDITLHLGSFGTVPGPSGLSCAGSIPCP
jgi:hypothetical protein